MGIEIKIGIKTNKQTNIYFKNVPNVQFVMGYLVFRGWQKISSQAIQ